MTVFNTRKPYKKKTLENQTSKCLIELKITWVFFSNSVHVMNTSKSIEGGARTIVLPIKKKKKNQSEKLNTK